jgi:hypothetical protein
MRIIINFLRIGHSMLIRTLNSVAALDRSELLIHPADIRAYVRIGTSPWPPVFGQKPNMATIKKSSAFIGFRLCGWGTCQQVTAMSVVRR